MAPGQRIQSYTGTSASMTSCIREVTVIRQMAPVHLIVHTPTTEDGKIALAKRVADVHAAAVTQYLKSLNCPTRQKLALLDAVIDTARSRE